MHNHALFLIFLLLILFIFNIISSLTNVFHQQGFHYSLERIIMDIYFDRLKKRSAILGNHFKKYLTIIEKNLDSLMERLENAGMKERIHLWVNSPDYRKEMQTILLVGTSQQEKLDDLGCYFALQFLQMNLSALDDIALAVTSDENKHVIYKEFMLQVGHDFRKLTATYMEQLMHL